MTEVGLGTSPFGNLFHETTDTDTGAATVTFWNGGVRYFDTAPHYGLGLAERRLGSALRQFPREEYVLSTKVGRRRRVSTGSGSPLSTSCISMIRMTTGPRRRRRASRR